MATMTWPNTNSNTYRLIHLTRSSNISSSNNNDDDVNNYVVRTTAVWQLCRMSAVNTITYFCPGSCASLTPEQPRDTGEQLFGPADDEEETDDFVFSVSEQTGQQQQHASAKAKPEPGTFYSISETCVAGNFSNFLYTLIASRSCSQQISVRPRTRHCDIDSSVLLVPGVSR